tara:strand:- start:79 stop:675 length:597 start_codon:yes stop_codon:yes gene_type:complete
MKLHKYKDYDEYKEIQIKGYESKEGVIWVNTDHLKNILAPYILKYNPDVSFGICHGTRRGLEQKAFINGFKKNVTVIGTEIAPEASKKWPHTIEWDFHNVKDEWIGNVDFIYSNSFDHSYKPEDCLDVWISCLNERGLCILEWTEFHGEKGANKLDPFGASYKEYTEMFEKKYEIVDILSHVDKFNRHYFIIKNKENK